MRTKTDEHFGLLDKVDSPKIAAPDREVTAFRAVTSDMTDDEISRHLYRASIEARRRAIQTIGAAGAGHVGGEFSIIDTLITLYLGVMNISPEQVESGDPERDRLILSKGHAANALYTVLAVGGYIAPQALRTFLQTESMLNGHPARNKIRAIEANTGPLGHGLPVGVGCAIGAKIDDSDRRVFVILGDGELQEGSNWEAFMTASQFGLDNLTAIVDRNGLQQGATVAETNDLEPLSDKLRAFGWKVDEVNGHHHGDLYETLMTGSSGRPRVVIADTIKGYPVSYMSNNVAWHHKVPTDDEIQIAVAELDKSLEEIGE